MLISDLALLLSSFTLGVLSAVAILRYHHHRHSRDNLMAVITAFQPALDSLDASATAIAALVGAGTTLPEGAASAQDITDTLDAVNAKAASVAGALPQPEASPEG